MTGITYLHNNHISTLRFYFIQSIILFSILSQVRRFSILPGQNDDDTSDGFETDVTADDLSSCPEEDTEGVVRTHGHTWHKPSPTMLDRIGLPIATSTPEKCKFVVMCMTL